MGGGGGGGMSEDPRQKHQIPKRVPVSLCLSLCLWPVSLCLCLRQCFCVFLKNATGVES
jgi:hypothetical protein